MIIQKDSVILVIEKKDVECTNCKLQQDEYRKGFLIKNEFVKFCYNLNPECDKKISNRDCLAFY